MVRYKLKNISIIPGPREPELSLNAYIDPLVSDILDFWEGIQLQIIGNSTHRQIIRCAVICASCDLLARKKLCGHNARLGCSKCKKEFLTPAHAGFGVRGFDRRNWIPRTVTEHRSDCESLLLCTSKTQLRKRDSDLGCRYSCLLKLPYFVSPTMLVVVPRQNLFLGLAKHFTKRVPIDKRLLVESDLEVIQKRIDKYSV